MCGIAGYLGDQIIPGDRIQGCLAQMRRRGPDYAAYYKHEFAYDRRIYLLHSRLSIIDLDARSNQPFRIGSKVMIYNGELYNYLEVRQQLKNRRLSFDTASDTEALLKVVDYFGWRAGLDKCEGMWAFALYDELDGSLLLSRDRFGEKPLYLYRDASGLYFGSEIKFIVALIGHRLEINYNHLHRYLVNGYRALYKTKETFFMGIEELPPASALHIDFNQKETLHKYWKPEFIIDESMGYAHAVEGVREHLISSVKLRLRADVPLAFYLSGGVDSNSLISIAKRVFNYDVHGFTIMNTDERYEERDMVEHSVSELGVRHCPVPISTKDFLPKMHTLVKYHDAPVVTINYFANWQLMKNIAEHGYRIAISGSAADEIFSGYYDHHLFYLYMVRGLPELFASSLQSWEEGVKPHVRNPYLRDPKLFLDHPDFRSHLYMDAPEFAKFLVRDWAEPFEETHFTADVLRNRMLNETFHECVPVYLHEEDLNAMYYSIENRSPYLDRNLVEFCYRIPTRHLVRDGRAKAVLRDAMRGIAPDRILDNRRKVGFNVPIFDYLDVDNREVRDYLLDDSPIYDHVRRDRIEALINSKELPNSDCKFLFYFVSSKIFLELFSE